MLVAATPGQTTSYTLHNNNSSASATATTKKQGSVNVTSTSSTSGIPKSIINNTTTTSTLSTSTPVHSTKHNHNNFNFPTPPHRNATNTATASSKEAQHSMNNSESSKPTSFIANLKETVQKALVNTATSLSRNCNQTTIAAVKTSNSTNNNNTFKSTTGTSSLSTNSQYVTSSSSSRSTTKNSSANNTNTSAASSTSISSTILPLTVARKRISQASIAIQPKLHTIPPTILHRCPEEREHANSTDSLQKEMCHFKPIRTAPTTPWKSGSKSRGCSLRFPKANLATKNTEFILKSNCDVNNRMKKTQPAKQVKSDPDDDEQENKEYIERFKPKPSSLQLSENTLTSCYQSAFVCLVAPMMNLVKIQLPPSGGNASNLQKTKSSIRIARTKDIENASSAIRPNLKKSKSAKDIAAASGNRSIEKTPNINEVSKKIAKVNEISSKITKAKSRRKLIGAKLKTINTLTLASQSKADKSQTPPTVDAGHAAAGEQNEIKSIVQRNTRKRKANQDIITEAKEMKNIASAAATPQAAVLCSSSRSSTAKTRRSGQASTDVTPHTSGVFKYPNKNASASTKRVGSFSPPMTRARLKQLQNNKAPAADVRKR